MDKEINPILVTERLMNVRLEIESDRKETDRSDDAYDRRKRIIQDELLKFVNEMLYGRNFRDNGKGKRRS